MKAHVIAKNLEDSTFYAFMAKRLIDHSKSSTWYIYFGAYQHFTQRKDWFIEYMAFSNLVFFDGGEDYIVIGKGNVQISFGGENFIFINVYYLSGMKLNFIFLSQIMCHCSKLDIIFSKQKCYIVDKESKKTITVGI